MNKQAHTAKILFWVNGVIHILAIIMEHELAQQITKPLLMVLLAAYFHFAVQRNGFTRWIMLAIIFSFGGDVALMFQQIQPIYFILGLASFLIGHLFYTYGMAKYPNFNQGYAIKNKWIALPLLGYGVGLVYFLWSGLGAMTVPVVIYSIVIMLMGLSAINMSGRVNTTAATYIIIGAILFILSDSVIALNKFKADTLTLPMPGLMIMVTYILGQFLIVEGIVKSEN